MPRGTNLRVATPGRIFQFTPAPFEPDVCRFLWNVSTSIRFFQIHIDPLVAHQDSTESEGNYTYIFMLLSNFIFLIQKLI
jgi:hypothetical protein